MVAAQRQRRGDIPHQRQDAALSVRQHQGEAEETVSTESFTSSLTEDDL